MVAEICPELNDIEVVWERKAHHLAHQTFADADTLDQTNPSRFHEVIRAADIKAK